MNNVCELFIFYILKIVEQTAYWTHRNNRYLLFLDDVSLRYVVTTTRMLCKDLLSFSNKILARHSGSSYPGFRGFLVSGEF